MTIEEFEDRIIKEWQYITDSIILSITLWVAKYSTNYENHFMNHKGMGENEPFSSENSKMATSENQERHEFKSQVLTSPVDYLTLLYLTYKVW